MTILQYRKRFPKAPIVSEAQKRRMRALLSQQAEQHPKSKGGRPPKTEQYKQAEQLHREHPKWSWRQIAAKVAPGQKGAAESLRLGVYRLRKKARITPVQNPE